MNIIFSSHVWLGAKNLYEKRAQKTLMELTPGWIFVINRDEQSPLWCLDAT